MKAISTFGRAMAQVMKSRMAFHDVTQGDMAAAMGISQSQLSKILRAQATRTPVVVIHTCSKTDLR